MGMNLDSGGKGVRPQMNVTPLVDVVLVLLIIFMIVIPAMEQGLDIEVPGVVHADEEDDNAVDPFLLSISSNGTMYWEKIESLTSATRWGSSMTRRSSS